MKFYFLIIFILFINCANQNKEELHGVSNLLLKVKMIKINQSNQNDIINIFGSPVISDIFNKNTWSYYEVKNKTSLFGKKIIILNNLVVFKFNNLGLLIDYKTYDTDAMNDIEFSNEITRTYREDNLVKSLLASTKKRYDLIMKDKKNNDE